ncbi:hypothetical protein Agabi119p4_5003 [Agaricus bisporus var. burnettii]|uniref:Uncharacterized protein n=1 Tax=Agaricus bisporus var. burnettii TaxID=192524 RepID=A0A8H7KHV2_AGABI|nr:hypothetical protein Agabi119p4_5003 [Agaricus bisporus var. burnettii]
MEVCRSSQQQPEAAVDLPIIKDIDIRKFYKLIGEHLPESAGDSAGQETGEGTVKHAFGTLQAFIDVLKSSLRDLEDNELEIYQYGDCAPAGHRSTTLSKPDIAIFRRNYALSQEEDNTFWSSIEMAMKYHSAKKTREQCLKEAATYVAYLLKARPDLISALGLLADPDSFDFLFCNATGIYKLSLSNEAAYMPLLSVVLRYLNGHQNQNVDSTLVRVRGSVLFDVSFPNASTSLGVSKGQATTFGMFSTLLA